MYPTAKYPVKISTVMLVFDGSHANSDQHLWKLATVIKLEAPTVNGRIKADRASATVAWQDGSVSSGHFVQAMRYPDSAAVPYVQL